MSIDNHTGIEDAAKQRPLDFIRENLEKIPKSMKEGEVVDEIVEDVSLRDVYHYITQIKANQDLDLKDLRIRYVSIRDLEQFATICDYRLIHNVKFPTNEEQRVYFIESSNFATTLIPIQLDDGSLNIFMEPLDSSPELIRQMFAELEDGERELLRELRKEKVEFIKKNRKEELALKEPWEI
jgi:hypothetical protein